MDTPVEIKKSATDDELVEFGKTQESRSLRPGPFHH